jgi:phage tail sheath protein FI
MASPTYPGVYITEQISSSHPITGVATSITAFVGYTATGIDGRAELLNSFSDYERLFGGLAADSELSYAVQQFFQNGGSQAYVVRVPRHGASKAQVVFGGLTFNALSSGAWANGEIIIDIDFANVGQQLSGTLTVTNGSPNVTGNLAGFKTNLAPNDWLVFSVDSTQTPYQILSITDDNDLVLGSGGVAQNYTGTSGSGTAIYYVDPTAFNLTVTNLADGTIEPFPLLSMNSNRANFVASIVNDPDNGSQLVSVSVGSPSPTVPPVQTGLVGKPITIGAVNAALASKALAGTVNVSASTTVTGTGTTFTTSVQAGQQLVFGADNTNTQYTIASVQNDTQLTLAKSYGGTGSATSSATVIGSIATAAFTVPFSVIQPTTPPSPLPIAAVTVFGQGAPIPQTVAGLASQLQKALNAALAVQLPGASVACSVAGTGAGQAIRVNATLPQYPDAIITFDSPAPTTDPLGISTTPTANMNVAHYALGTGNGAADHWYSAATSADLTSANQGTNGSGLPWTQDLIGDPSLNTGIYALTNVDIFNLLSIPDATRALPGNPNAHDPNVDSNSVYSAAIALCDRKRALLLIDPPPEVNNILSAVDWKTSGLNVSDENGACFFPRLRLLDPLNPGMLRTFAPSGVVAGVYATTDSKRGVWKAPAGTQATLNGVQSLVYKMTDAENGELNPLGVNCFRTFPIYGSILWGARTLVGADADANQWKYVPVRRTALFLEQSLYQGTQWVVFEPNDEPLWASIRLNIGSFMQNLFLQGAFQGSTPAAAYFVKCDSETTTQTDIDLGIVNILVGFAPLKPAEFVVIQIQQMAGAQPS